MSKSIKILAFVAILLVSMAFTSWAQTPTYPKPLGYVNDYAHILSASGKEAISAVCQELEAKTTAQIAIATVESTYPESIDTYAVNLFSRWGVGRRGKDNGLLIVVAKKDKKVWIEVGYGLEGIIPDAFAHYVYSKQLVPAFRKGAYGEGLLAATTIFAKKIADEKGVKLSSLSSIAQRNYPLQTVKSSLGKRIFSGIISFLFFIFILIFFGPLGLLFFGLGSRGGYWSGGGSGGFGGGFGGFGGGSCGGGGAGGGW